MVGELEQDFQHPKEYFYEVVIYKIYDNVVETADCKFFVTTSPFKGKDCVVSKKGKDVKFVKFVTEINGNIKE